MTLSDIQEIINKFAVAKNIKSSVNVRIIDLASTPGGGMNDVSKSMKLVRERILRLMQYDMWLKNEFDNYEKYYDLLTK